MIASSGPDAAAPETLPRQIAAVRSRYAMTVASRRDHCPRRDSGLPVGRSARRQVAPMISPAPLSFADDAGSPRATPRWHHPNNSRGRGRRPVAAASPSSRPPLEHPRAARACLPGQVPAYRIHVAPSISSRTSSDEFEKAWGRRGGPLLGSVWPAGARQERRRPVHLTKARAVGAGATRARGWVWHAVESRLGAAQACDCDVAS